MMKFSTRARYGLRLMVELARELKKDRLVHLGKIAGITGVSENYLAQLAMSLKNDGLLIGVSGKKGGYYLSRPASEIKISEIIKAVAGPISLTDCVNNPDICLNSSFCEARMIWVIMSGSMIDILEKYSLEDLIDKEKLAEVVGDHSHLPLLFPDKLMAQAAGAKTDGCPVQNTGSGGL
ncbi:MAG: Rrf2 family transcriptional regulator [candidate division Zixibacteria bacterium HGW-Zixibacteria-1]|nr:MAG: Rrf2 family transcriptional regulator [candidate division Zixibacteria bacterium HGW-Zixibacteria-1]